MKTVKAKKYRYYKVIQENWGSQWDDADFHECNSKGVLLNRKEFNENLRAYKENSPAPLRVIFRREKI